MKKRAWFILEIETGLVDGWYFNFDDDKEAMRRYWDEARPKYTHIIATTDSKLGYLPDSVCMNRAA